MASDDRSSEDAANSGFVIIKLAKPIKAHGEDITEIKCRPPTAGDIIAVGTPVRWISSQTGPPRWSRSMMRAWRE